MTEHGHTEEHSGSGGYEKRDVAVLKIFIVGVIAIAVIIGLIVIGNQLFVQTREKMTYEMELQPENPRLREIRAREAEILSSYALVDSAKGVYRIPIDRAMTVVAEETYRRQSEKVGK